MKFGSSLLAVFVFLGLAPAAQSAVLGYWRMEDSSNVGLDSGPNGYNMTNTGVGSYLLPASGRGSKFYDPIPSSLAANARSGNFVVGESDYLSVADPFTPTGLGDFTVEALVNVNTVNASGQTRPIVAQGSGTGNGSWQLAVTAADSGLGARNLILQLSSAGTSYVNIDSDFQLTLSSDYYLAASVDFSLSGVSVTFFLQDLTAGTALQSVTKTGAVTSVYNSTAALSIGRGHSGDSARYFDGLIDEVRISDTALTESGLLAVPEPSTVAMLAGGGLLLLSGLARRRRARR